MRVLRCLCIAVGFAAALEAQLEVPGDQCLGGTLLEVRPDSITTKFNEKILTFPLAPDVEIWRRGVDLHDTAGLVPGDNIYLRCKRAANGLVMASMVAAVEEGDAVDMVPHHIAALRVCFGRLIAVGKDSISVENDEGICVLHVRPTTEIWRGEVFHDVSVLRFGDEIGARAVVEYPSEDLIAESIEANVTKTEGTIVSVRSDSILINEYQYCGPDKDSVCPLGQVTILLDARTDIDAAKDALEPGKTVEAIGLKLGRSLIRATWIAIH